MKNKTDIYAKITAQIVKSIESGVLPWRKPWDVDGLGNGLPLRQCGTPYRGINILLLWSASVEAGFISPTWMTYKQAQSFKGQVRKGEKGTGIVYASTFTKTEERGGEEREKKIPFMKSYCVFNVDQIDGLPERFYKAPKPLLNPAQRIDHAETFFAATGAEIRHGGGRAYYSPATDHIQMPLIDKFYTAAGYYATLAHETVHWTKHKTRLDRDFGCETQGDEGYAREELVAELGAAFLSADLGLVLDIREDHASYIDSWLRVLKGDKKAIFNAASHAQKAIDLLHSMQSAKESAAA